LNERLTLGAVPIDQGQTRFRLWAPFHQQLELHILGPVEQIVVMRRDEQGYHEAVASAAAGARYLFRLPDGREFPDPASRYQPEGVHGPSAVVSTQFGWRDGQWKGLPLREYVIYELHTGTFTEEGTFDAIIPRLPELKELGITAIELMPVAEFPGRRNWGYDGVFLFAAHSAYGGVDGLQRLVDACHAHGLAIVLDVVYNHLGPEGNYLPLFAPYFTSKYRTPWGQALNFDDAHSDEVRRFFIENAIYWTQELHIDALRLDAVHAINDGSAKPFLQELAECVHEASSTGTAPRYLIAESDLNDPRLIRDPERGGFGLDAQWSDDFHHALHTVLTGEREGYYQDFGSLDDLVAAYRDTFVYANRYSLHRQRRHGAAAEDLDYTHFLAYSQNHDQVGNRMLGERLSMLVSFEQLKLAAAAVMLSPCIPLLFMGEEHGEKAPFLYFTSHTDEGLVEAVRNGRREEFSSFSWQGEAPDPDALETFERSRIRPQRNTLWKFYQRLIELRRHPALQSSRREDLEVWNGASARTLRLIRTSGDRRMCIVLNFEESAVSVETPSGSWRRILDSAATEWDGPGAPGDEQAAAHSVVVYENADHVPTH
jgi:maltooligosyltrehalose trehalohydrolase